QELALFLAESNKFVSCQTPSGFPFVNGYRKQISKRPHFPILGELRQKKIIVDWDGDALAKGPRSVSSAVVANVVHAYDAALLMLWVNALGREGIKDVVTVHDCIGCHAPDVETMRDIGLKALRRMYIEHDPLAEICAAAEAASNRKPPAPLDRGDYNYDELLKAKYAFN